MEGWKNPEGHWSDETDVNSILFLGLSSPLFDQEDDDDNFRLFFFDSDWLAGFGFLPNPNDMIGSIDQVRLSVIGPEGSSGASGSGTGQSGKTTGRQASLEGTLGESSNLLQLPRDPPRPKTGGISKRHLEVTIVSEKTASEEAEEEKQRLKSKIESSGVYTGPPDTTEHEKTEKKQDLPRKKKSPSQDDILPPSSRDEPHSKKDDATKGVPDSSSATSSFEISRRGSGSTARVQLHQAQTHLHRHLHQLHQKGLEGQKGEGADEETCEKQGTKDNDQAAAPGKSSEQDKANQEKGSSSSSSHTVIEDEILYIWGWFIIVVIIILIASHPIMISSEDDHSIYHRHYTIPSSLEFFFIQESINI